MTKFGPHLQFWRKARRLSQLQLALEADVSSRHISFLETGRAQPSRAMIRHLSDILDVPNARRNELFDAAGFAPQHQRSALSDDHMQMVSGAMSALLSRHDPFPAVVLDPLWTLVQMNQSASKLFAMAGLGPGASLLDAAKTPGTAAQMIENWGEVGHHMLQRLRTESRAAGGILALDQAAEALVRDPDIAAYQPPAILPPIITTIYRSGPLRLPLFSTFVQFGGAEDLAISDLKIELMFPADPDAETLLRAL
ncbi:Xre family transcriptional regulator [Litoreibacter ponti]|uniref:Xre family transcriptional regulator n=1 Tax=Litoreibacter ponti TaxID=1510457 RepID=A0A2T6BJ34_9RHOB|nr:helix-turn-helix transcriptional regulator [Litoreibacter ponti]PTX56062.1 Xre family transcriptional regulator [Litoreibacter ponti]